MKQFMSSVAIACFCVMATIVMLGCESSDGDSDASSSDSGTYYDVTDFGVSDTSLAVLVVVDSDALFEITQIGISQSSGTYNPQGGKGTKLTEGVTDGGRAVLTVPTGTYYLYVGYLDQTASGIASGFCEPKLRVTFVAGKAIQISMSGGSSPQGMIYTKPQLNRN